MSRRKQRSRRPAKPARRTRGLRRPRAREEPDLLDRIAAALADDDPLVLLALASMMLAVVDPRSRSPFGPPADTPGRDELLESFFGVPVPETSALLAALAGLSNDDVLRRRVLREIADRGHVLPEWLAGLSRTAASGQAVELTHVLGDGDSLLVAATLPGGHPLTAVVYVDHNMGTVVKDAFVLSDPLDEVLATLHAASENDPDMVARPLDPAAARARITEAVQLGAISYPPFETDTWPACRALVEWMAGLLPGGGTGYDDRPEWGDGELDDLARRFRASAFADGVDDPGDLLSTVLRFGADYAPGDPLRMSPVAVELLLLDRIPRKVVAPVDDLAVAPDLLRAFIRFCHQERGIRPALTEQTIAAVDACEADYQTLIRTERPQGPAALLAAMGVLDAAEPDLELIDFETSVAEIMLDALRRAVGGDNALETLDADPLPDEPFDWDVVPSDVHARVGEVLDLVDRCCTELLDAEYGTACRRLLADVATGDPDIFRRRGRPATAAATICWLVGQANGLFDREPGTPTLAVKDLVAHFGIGGSTVSQRSGPLLRAIGVENQQYGRKDLGSARYLTGGRRRQIITDRDRYRATSVAQR